MKRIIIAVLALLLVAAAAYGVQTTKTADIVQGSLQLLDDLALVFGTDNDATIEWDGSKLLVTSANTSFTGPASFGGDVSFADSLGLVLGTGSDATIEWDGSKLLVTSAATSFTGTVTMAADKAFTLGAGSLKWDTGTYDAPTMVYSGLALFANQALFGAGAAIGDDVNLEFGEDSDWSCGFDGTNYVCEAKAAASAFNVDTGNLTVGSATWDHTPNGTDACIAGFVEINGMSYLDGGATVATSETLSYATASTAPWINSSKALVSGAFSLASGANTACATTCTASKVCLFGFDDGSADAETIVACDDAAADKCVCLGAAS